MIFVPQAILGMLFHFGPSNKNPVVCTKVEFEGYEISISCDASHGGTQKDLTRTDIRVYKDGADVTQRFEQALDEHILTDGNDLFRVMQYIRSLKK